MPWSDLEQAIFTDGIVVDESEWPYLRIRFAGRIDETAIADWLRTMDAALQRQQPFVMVMENGSLLDFPPQQKKHQVLWFKANREAVGQYCRGIVRLVRDQEQAAKLSRPQLQQAFPCPLKIVYSAAEARKVSQALMQETPVC